MPLADGEHAFAIELARAGARPAASAAERRAHEQVEERFRGAGLRIGRDRFEVPGLGRSRNIIGILDRPARCLVVIMAHVDTMPATPGAEDNASGVGVLTAVAPRLERLEPECDTWLAAATMRRVREAVERLLRSYGATR